MEVSINLSKLTNLDKRMTQLHISMATLNEHIAEIQTRASASEDNFADADKKISATKNSRYAGIQGELSGEQK